MCGENSIFEGNHGMVVSAVVAAAEAVAVALVVATMV